MVNAGLGGGWPSCEGWGGDPGTPKYPRWHLTLRVRPLAGARLVNISGSLGLRSAHEAPLLLLKSIKKSCF